MFFKSTQYFKNSNPQTTPWSIYKMQRHLCLVADERIQREMDGATCIKIVPVCLCRIEGDVMAVSRGITMMISLHWRGAICNGKWNREKKSTWYKKIEESWVELSCTMQWEYGILLNSIAPTRDPCLTLALAGPAGQWVHGYWFFAATH